MQRLPESPTQELSAEGVARRDRLRLLVVAISAVCVLLLAEWASSRLVSADAGDLEPNGQRPENVSVVSKYAANLEQPHDRPSVWLFGNSHTYALPGLAPGNPLRPSEQGIVIDELAARLAAAHPSQPVDFYLTAYPNFLPFEMLTRAGHAIYVGHRPAIVIIGVTWRNIARDSLPRYDIFLTYRDAKFCQAFEQMLSAPDVDAAPAVLDEVRAQVRQVQHDEEQERLKSDSDRIDEVLTDWLSDRSTLMGHSAELRSQLFRTMTDRVQQTWSTRSGVEYSYDLVEHDYAFNVECLQALLRLLVSQGSQVICYYAPERDDLPPLMDPEPQQAFMDQFARQAEALGVVVLDARHVVPSEYWGWVGDTPDRSHFTEPGHQRLAQFLLDEIEKRSLWKELPQR